MDITVNDIIVCCNRYYVDANDILVKNHSNKQILKYNGSIIE